MNPTAFPPESRDCESVGELLSWYANGTLGAADRTVVDAHIALCDVCRATLALERRIVESMRAPRDNVEQSPHAGWQKLSARLDAEDGAMSPDESEISESRAAALLASQISAIPPAPKGAIRMGRPRVNWPAALGAAVAVQAAAIAVLAVALVRHRQAAEAPVFQTLSQADPTLAARGPLVRIAFDSTIDEATARQIATQVDGRILAGPSPENVYTFVFREGQDAARTLDDRVSGLRRQAHVLLVEPVFLGEQPHQK